VNVRILEIDGERRRLSLSLKRVEEGEQPVPRADGAESVHTMPDLKLSEEAFPAVAAVEPADDVEPADEVERTDEVLPADDVDSPPEAVAELEVDAEVDVETEAELEVEAHADPAEDSAETSEEPAVEVVSEHADTD